MEITKLKQKIAILRFFDGSASILLGLGLYGHFADNIAPTLSFLEQPNMAINLLTIGAIGSGVLSLLVLKETKKLKSLEKQQINRGTHI